MTSDWDQIDYQVSNQQISIHNTDIAFSARAPPFVGEDVVFTGAHIQGGGDACVVGDAEVQRASLNFDANLVATNKTLSKTEISGAGLGDLHKTTHRFYRPEGQAPSINPSPVNPY